MEPLHSYNGEHYEEEHIKPHIVYRKDAPKTAKDEEKDDTAACDAAGKKVAFYIFLNITLINAKQLSGVLLKFHR